MQALLSYIIKTIVCSGILFGYYWFFLRNKGFHAYNRFYLLWLVAASLLLPLIKVDFWQPQDVKSSNVIKLLQAIPGTGENIDGIYSASNNNNWSFEQWLMVLYISISVALLLTLALSLYKLWQLINSNAVNNRESISLINTSANGTPFSFFHFIFWNNDIDIDSPTGRQMLLHELAHVQQKHSYDKLFINVTTALFWCNPILWLVKKELAMVHEFAADKLSVDENDTGAFAAMILRAAYPRQAFHLTNNFFHSPIKRRLTMLTKNSNRVGYISRMAALPLFLLVFTGFTFKTVTQKPLYKGEKTIVVIDAGHGGHDFGAKADNGTFEKEITLALAQRIKEKNTNSRIEIILSRSDDAYFSPQQRVDFAKTKNADLFISLHVDAEEKTSHENKSGIHLSVPPDTNIAYKQSEILGSALISTLNEIKTLPVNNVINKISTGAWVLKANHCPAVLIETGYITNATDLAFLESQKAPQALAKSILDGIEKYLTARVKEN